MQSANFYKHFYVHKVSFLYIIIKKLNLFKVILFSPYWCVINLNMNILYKCVNLIIVFS